MLPREFYYVFARMNVDFCNNITQFYVSSELENKSNLFFLLIHCSTSNLNIFLCFKKFGIEINVLQNLNKM